MLIIVSVQLLLFLLVFLILLFLLKRLGNKNSLKGPYFIMFFGGVIMLLFSDKGSTAHDFLRNNLLSLLFIVTSVSNLLKISLKKI